MSRTRVYIKNKEKPNELYDENYFPEAKPIRFYPKLFNELLNCNNTRYHSMKPKPYTLVKLDRYSGEFNGIGEEFYRSLKTGSIHDIYRIENPYLYLQYQIKKLHKIRRNGFVEEYVYYHTTDEKNVDSICTNNFNWRLHGMTKGHKHGHGVSFSPRMSFANLFSANSEIKVMFIVDVLETKSHLGKEYHIIPEDDCDTTKSGNGNVCVKFEDAEFLPKYVIFYEIYNAEHYNACNNNNSNDYYHPYDSIANYGNINYFHNNYCYQQSAYNFTCDNINLYDQNYTCFNVLNQLRRLL